jgi:hypothetical protein
MLISCYIVDDGVFCNDDISTVSDYDAVVDANIDIGVYRDIVIIVVAAAAAVSIAHDDVREVHGATFA